MFFQKQSKVPTIGPKRTLVKKSQVLEYKTEIIMLGIKCLLMSHLILELFHTFYKTIPNMSFPHEYSNILSFDIKCIQKYFKNKYESKF